MITWHRKGAAVIGDLHYTDGRNGHVILVGDRTHPNSAAIVLHSSDSEEAPETIPLHAASDYLTPAQYIAALAMQERVFGASPLQAPPRLRA